MSTLEQIKRVLTDRLQLGPRGQGLEPSTPLLGAIPEFDSMAVVGVIAALEDEFGIAIMDDEITADIFATVGSLSTFVAEKTAAG